MSKQKASKETEPQTRENPDVVIVKTATAPKLSPRGEGGITYQVGRVGEDVYVRIEKNEGGGSHSREFVGLSAIRGCITPAMGRGEPFKSDALAGAFVGRSQCNSGFLVASLRAEGIFGVDGERKGLSILIGDLDAWEKAAREAAPLLGEDGQPVTAKLHPEPKDTKFRKVEAASGDSTGGGESKPSRVGRIRKKATARLADAPDSGEVQEGETESATDGEVPEVEEETAPSEA